MCPLTVLQVSYAKPALRTSEELRALEESLQRLTLANESLSKSNRTLTDILYLQQQGAKNPGSGIANTAYCMTLERRSLDGHNDKPSITPLAVPTSPKTGSTKLQKSTGSDSTRDHLQRCMGSVQELAKTIASAMSVWQGHEKTGSTDIHGSHTKLIAELGKLPVELECKQCHGRVPWAEFDLSKATSTCLGTCTCTNQRSSSLWRPYDTTASASSPLSNSDSSFDPYYSQRHAVYTSPRGSTDRVIPISSQTYLNPPSVTSANASSTRPAPRYDAYSGRPRRSSMLDGTRSGSTNPPPSRNRPIVVQADSRSSSPPRHDRPEFHIQPASSKETKPSRHLEHKKVYSVDEGSAKHIANVNLVPGGESQHRQKDTGGMLGYRTSGYDRGRKSYHPTGKSPRTIDDDNAYSYTDPASMYKDTEPRWRETRPRRGSVDRGGASPERPVSMIEPYGADPRRSTREIGPPPSQRGWDKINDLGRSSSTRDPARDSGFAPLDSQYPKRDRSYAPDPKHKEDHRSYEDYDRDSSDRDRPRKDDSHRHHRRRESERDDKKDGDNSLSGAAKIAAGGLGAAATLFGLNREKGKKEDREREEREEQERKREQARRRELERSREYDNRRDREGTAESDRPERRRRGGASSEDDPPVERQRDPYPEPDRGLGFAFEGPGEGQKARDAPRDAPREPVAPVAPAAPHEAPRPQPRHDNSMDRDIDRPYDAQPQAPAPAPPPVIDADEDYRRRMEQVQRELGLAAPDHTSDSDPDRERRRREREARQAERLGRKANGFHDQTLPPGPPSSGMRASFEDDASQAPSQSTWASTNNGQEQELRRRASVLDSSMDAGLMAQVIDNSQSEKRENRVRIVDPPSDEEDKKPKGILKRPTSKFPKDPNAVREGVAPLKDVCISCCLD